MRTKILLLVVFLEGFTTLAFQMVALRKAVPYVGSSVVLTSVVIGIILLALSAGYYFGGVLTSRLSESTLLKRLQLYLIIAGLYYLLIVYPSFERALQTLLSHIGFVPTLFVFALVFFALPTFLASHTMPIITQVSNGSKGYAAGKILFISTLGSFLGSTLTTLVLFPSLGVYWTGIAASIILFLCGALIYPYKKITPAVVLLIVLFCAATVFHPSVQGRYEDTSYQTLRVIEGKYHNKDVRLMQLNGGWASGIEVATKKSFFPYVRYIAQVVQSRKPQNIAIIGAAGCSLPQELAQHNFVSHIDLIDIDARVFPIAQDVFLQEKLDNKIVPIVQSARGRVYDMIKSGKKYDMIIVDAYNGSSIPDELLTQEFFNGLHQLTSQLVLNVITDKSMTSDFSKGFLRTLSLKFPRLYAHDASSTTQADVLGNKVIANFSESGMQEIVLPQTNILYTDDKNVADELRVGLIYNK